MGLNEKLNQVITTGIRYVADKTGSLCYPAAILEAKVYSSQDLITPADIVDAILLPGMNPDGTLNARNALESVALAANRFQLPIKKVYIIPSMLDLQAPQVVPSQFEGKLQVIGTGEQDDVVQATYPFLQFFAGPNEGDTYSCEHVEFVDDSLRTHKRQAMLRDGLISPLCVEIGF
jgi:hypothetical protein